MNLSKNKCNELIDLAETKSKWIRISKNRSKSYYVCSIDLDDVLESGIKTYCKSNMNLDIKNVNVFILRYEPGDYFNRHIDQNEHSEFNRDFLYNVNVRLNDDFEGGEFWLNDKPFHRPIGEVYHYKSTEWHEVKKITKGKRYTALFYIRYRDIKDNKKILI